MKTKTIVTVLLVAFILASCAPTSTSVPPTEMAVPISTTAPIPPTPTSMPTPAPENIADAKDLPVWVDEFVHAYGDKITVNGAEMNASQLTDEIRKNGETFKQIKEINGVTYSFLMINDLPLAIQANEIWEEATMARLGELSGIRFEFSWRPTPNDEAYKKYLVMLKKVAPEGTRFSLSGNLQKDVFGNFTDGDWRKIISDWENIKSDFKNKKVPGGFPYNFSNENGFSFSIKLISDSVSKPGFRIQHLLDATEHDLVDTISAGNFNKEEYLKILEYMVRTCVISYQQVQYWDVTDEITNGYVSEIPENRFWENKTGKSPAELAKLTATWAKESNPTAKTYIVEDAIFDTANPDAKQAQEAFDQFIIDLKESNAPVDGVIVENNFWIFEPPDWNIVANKIDPIQSLGYEIGGSETMIDTSDVAINSSPRRIKIVKVDDRNIAQAKIYSDLFNLYLRKGIKVLGFGGIDDANAWTNDVGQPDANPLIFDDNLQPKPSYYAIVQTLYEQLP